MKAGHSKEREKGNKGAGGSEVRFQFGRNWRQFLDRIGEEQLFFAARSLTNLFGREGLLGRSFLDVGSGSGLSSLAAVHLGARVHSFDYDEECIACTAELKQRYYPDKSNWAIEKGSVLDQGYLHALGKFDIVYSWGVLHHTGAMWQALADATIPVREEGRLCVSIYNDQGYVSRIWGVIKWAYNRLPGRARMLILVPAFLRLWGPTILKDLLRHRSLKTWKRYASERGMSPWYDVIDWVGGYPFEVAKPEEVVKYVGRLGFRLRLMRSCGRGRGCNEFVFERMNAP